MTFTLGHVYQNPNTQERHRCVDITADRVVFSLLDATDGVTHVEFRIFALTNALLATFTDVTDLTKPYTVYRFARNIILHDTKGPATFRVIRILTTPELSSVPGNYGCQSPFDPESPVFYDGQPMIDFNAPNNDTTRFVPRDLEPYTTDYVVVRTRQLNVS